MKENKFMKRDRSMKRESIKLIIILANEKEKEECKFQLLPCAIIVTVLLKYCSIPFHGTIILFV
jgi:hypothetical protein